MDYSKGLSNVEAMDGYMLADKLNPRQFAELAGLDYEVAEVVYAAYAAVADKTAGARIDSHRRIGADAYETRYTNGVRVLVNYADEPMDFEGIAISAQGYAVI